MSQNSLKYNRTCNRIFEALNLDKELNIANNLRWPCSVCNKNVTATMKAVQCDSCDKWCHIKCHGISPKEYEVMVNSDDNIDWTCLYCTIKFNKENFAFTQIDYSELNKINNSNSMKFCEFLPKLENIAESNRFIQEFKLCNHDDFDYNFPSYLKSKYYSVTEFQSRDGVNNLNIFNSNVNGLENKLDILHNFIVDSNSDIEILSITETSEQTDRSFLSNVALDDYSLFHTPSNSSKGGTALYVKKIYKPIERHDLKFQYDSFESV